MKAHFRQRGFTLVELIISMVIIAVALGGVLLVINNTIRSSADPMISEQAIAIAEAYMEEILSKNYAHAVEPGENRTTFDDVTDYAAIGAEVPTDQYNTLVFGPGGNGYSVTVTLGAATAIGGQNMLPINVTVTHAASGTAFSLNGYRGNW